MLDLIQSEYFKKNLLLYYLQEKTKLKLGKYNKQFQKKIGVNIINYRLLSERYIIYESKEKGKRKGKEYRANGDELIFEGEYLNGERNGYGKELSFFSSNQSIQNSIINFYNDSVNLYEGEYLNGKRTGKGKEFNWNNILVFEGEYLNNKRHGKGKEYDGNELIFQGTYFKGKKHGEGKEYYENGGLKYKGKYINGFKWEGLGFNMIGDILYELKEGKGHIIEYDLNGKLIYEGDNINGKGKYYYYNSSLEYEGEFLNGEKNGKGKEYKSK